MKAEIETALCEKYAVSAIVFIHRQKFIYKYDLKTITKSHRQIESLTGILKSVGIIWIDDISYKKRKEYRISLTALGRTIAENLENVDGNGTVARMFSAPLQDLLIEAYVSGAGSLIELPKARLMADVRKLLFELNSMRLIELERRPSGAPNLSSPVPFRVTPRGKDMAKNLLVARKAMEVTV